MKERDALTQAFQSRYKELNVAQKQAVDTIEGPVVVIAGPGTGKTTILTLRIANILRQTDTAPENILALTFTESGAFNMRRKLFEIIGPAAYKVNIHTFHGFAARIIEKYPDYFPRIIGSSVITEPEQVKIIEHALESRNVRLLRPYGDHSYYVAPILREIQILKRENVSPERLRSDLRGEPQKNGSVDIRSRKKNLRSDLRYTSEDRLQKQLDKNLELAEVYEAYEAALAKNKYYDFEDMLLELIRALENPAEPEFKLILQEEYQYILADEHQDANQSQNRILELLSDFHDNPNLFIVGDDKQAIYRFQGASLENFLYFKQKYPAAKVIDLEHNYRSHQGILDAAHNLIVNNPSMPGHSHKPLRSLQIGSVPIYVTECRTEKSELEYVAQFVKRFVDSAAKKEAEKSGEGESKKEETIAILYRDNKHAEAMSATLKAHGVAHRIESDNDLLKEPEVTKILILCRAIYDPSSSEDLAKALLLRELGCDPGEVQELLVAANRERKPLHAAIKASRSASIKKAYTKIVNWSDLAQTLPFSDFLQRLIQETNIMASIVTDPNSLERLSTLQAFYDYVAGVAHSKKTFYLRDFIEHIQIAEDHGISARRNYNDHVSGVRLMTTHRAKGLEFNHVFIIHASNGIWGNRTSRNLFTIPVIEHARNVGRLEDERRLFYVALTRARETVHVSYALSDGDKELLPTQFISEMAAAATATATSGVADNKLVEFDKLDLDAESVYSHHFFRPPKAEEQSKVMNSILDPSFVRSKFLAQPLSVTHLNNFLACPWQYYFVNLIRVPQAPTKHQMYGTAIHNALRIFFNKLKEGETFSMKKLLALFKHGLDMQPMSVDDRADSLIKGQKALEGYVETYVGTWNPHLLTEYSLKAGLDLTVGSGTNLGNLELTGKLDKVEFIDGPKSDAVAVIDYKTSKPKSRNEIEGKTRGADGNYKRQLVFYKLLIDSNTSKRDHWHMRYGEIDFIEPNERGIYKKERFEVSDTEVKELKQAITEMAKDITSLSFIDKGCGKKDCEYCALGKLLVAR